MANSKIFNDSVHGHIELPPLLVRIIDTPQFQRLRYIKQLGAGYYVYPGACHNRFEHSIGVAHLAGKFLRSLRENQPELNITDDEIQCVQIAGLCHDLGHGPLSHKFESFVRKMGRVGYRHEDTSCRLLEHLVTSNNLHHYINEDMLLFIKALILGEVAQDRSFLYEIVANSNTGIDVDKMDYFARDCHHLGMQCNFDHNRYFLLARVLKLEGKQHICIKDKEAANMYELFHTRDLLHRRAYKHHAVCAIQMMFADALLKAKSIRIPGTDRHVGIADAVDDMVAFTNLTDSIFERILLEPLPEDPLASQNLKEAKEILRRIQKRDLYRVVYKSKPIPSPTDISLHREKLGPDFEVEKLCFNYGAQNCNPVKELLFYSKDQKDNPRPISKNKVSNMLPEIFEETQVLIFFKRMGDLGEDEKLLLTEYKNNLKHNCA